MPDLDPAATQPPTQKPPAGRYFRRFTREQRYMHAVLFTTFLGLAGTGLPIRFSESIWARGLAKAVGGFGAILFFHKLFAVVLTIAFLLHLKEVFQRGLLHREKGVFWGPNSMVGSPKDVKDLFAHLRWFVGLGPRPQFDRYAYWEKFDYWAVFWGMIVIGFSGYAMWFGSFFARLIPGSWLNIALLIHGEEALLATGWIFVIHFFNTHLRPENFPMDLTIFTGRLSEEELKRMHPEEYDRLVKNGGLQAIAAEAPAPWLNNFGRVVGTTAVVAGLIMLVLMTIAFIRG